MSYPQDGCLPGCREAGGRGRKQDGRDLSTWLGHGEGRSDKGLLAARRDWRQPGNWRCKQTTQPYKQNLENNFEPYETKRPQPS